MSFIRVRDVDGRIQIYSHVLLEVRTRDEQSVPRLLDYCPDEEEINVRVRRDFVTAFVKAEVFGVKVCEEAVQCTCPEDRCFGARRSHSWAKLQLQVLAARPNCDWCLKPATVGHHVVPFHVDPGRELDESNIGSCCDICHAVLAHFVYRWDLYDPEYWEHAREFKARLIAAKETQRGKRA